MAPSREFRPIDSALSLGLGQPFNGFWFSSNKWKLPGTGLWQWSIKFTLFVRCMVGHYCKVFHLLKNSLFDSYYIICLFIYFHLFCRLRESRDRFQRWNSKGKWQTLMTFNSMTLFLKDINHTRKSRWRWPFDSRRLI